MRKPVLIAISTASRFSGIKAASTCPIASRSTQSARLLPVRGVNSAFGNSFFVFKISRPLFPFYPKYGKRTNVSFDGNFSLIFPSFNKKNCRCRQFTLTTAINEFIIKSARKNPVPRYIWGSGFISFLWHYLINKTSRYIFKSTVSSRARPGFAWSI